MRHILRHERHIVRHKHSKESSMEAYDDIKWGFYSLSFKLRKIKTDHMKKFLFI